MIINNFPELKLHSVSDRGIPNKEKIVIYVEENTNMGQYGIILGHTNQDKTTLPYNDNFYWFGDGLVTKGDWITLYTGKGKPTSYEWEPTKGTVYSIHWGRDTTMFTNTNIVPILFKVGAVELGIPPTDQPQLGLEKN